MQTDLRPLSKNEPIAAPSTTILTISYSLVFLILIGITLLP